ncbi:ATP-binding protein [Arcobacter porcinus]|uniref:ATP-binding protein n=1 Tax=Arcobacter porcinus TaxID=1935204 RepID=UPI00081E6F6C|nr:ATP-binding protein [Arcobacter porcinus]OCL83057.1 ATP-dependent zinc metalloprotease FtsH [Arcobacter porcinus]OCL83452.1 ATP-dependent zinc metalloprotease FtsH [Arcobacter porcinus]OCL88225.1 ATP-dependent zinc metalloprotease FtsH [Arcobacter porcinus]
MQEVIDFLKEKDVENTKFFAQLKCSIDEAKILQYLSKEYMQGRDVLSVIDILTQFYNIEKYEHLEKLNIIKSLLELGWVIQIAFEQVKLNEASKFELINSSISLSSAYLKMLESGTSEFILPEIRNYSDHLEYLQDQFLKIDISQQLNSVKRNFDINSPNTSRLKNKLLLIENRIKDRINATTNKILIEEFFKEHNLNEQEQTLFLALLKEEYSGGDGTLREMNYLLELISNDDYEKIKYRSLLEESSTLISKNLFDYDEVLTPFGGINRNFYITDEVLYKISHPNKKGSQVAKIKLETIIKEQEMFELITTTKTLEDVVLNPKTKETLDNLLKQVDKSVINRLKSWGIKDKKRGIDAKIIFYGLAGTGKTITALALARSLKKDVLSFDCSKILSMYIGESEKNVRNIFDKYNEIKEQTKTEPVLLLNEADQFLSSRTSGTGSSADKMHNQMQNIFLEQIERFDGILIATTNLLENLDKAFSRRFNYKIEFTKPNHEQRVKLWKKLTPSALPLEKDFDFEKIANHELTGGQIELVIKNTAYKLAVNDNAVFTIDDFEEQITKEKKSQFDKETKVGFF